MTLEEAVSVLNREKHLGWNRWRPGVGGYRTAGPSVYGSDDPGGNPEHLTAFEAIAIAEKYERQRHSLVLVRQTTPAEREWALDRQGGGVVIENCTITGTPQWEGIDCRPAA